MKAWIINNHDSYVSHIHIWNKISYTKNLTAKENAHKLFPPPFGTLDEKLKNNEYIQNATKYIETPIAKGSDYSGAAVAFYEGGHVPSLVSHTISSFISLANQHEATVELPSRLEYVKNNASKDGKSLDKVYVEILTEVLSKGRQIVLLDTDESDNKLKIVLYKAESMKDWGATKNETDDGIFSYCIIEDKKLNDEYDPTSGKNDKYIDIVFYHTIENNVYTVKKQESINGKVIDEKTITPSFMGKKLDFIPILAIGSVDNTPDVDPPPLEGIAECVVQIYKLTCLLYHAERTSSVPTMYGTGIDEDSVPDVTGADVFIPLVDTQSTLGYTKTDTSQMKHLQERIDGFYFQAQELGASILGSRKGTSESGEALRLRQAASTATLKSIVTNVGHGIEKILKMMAKWVGSPDELRFDPSKEFSTFSLTANETIALLQAWQGRAVSHSTLLENYRKAGMLQPGETVEDEMSRLAIDGEMFEDVDDKVNLGVGKSLPPKKPLDKKIL